MVLGGQSYEREVGKMEEGVCVYVCCCCCCFALQQVMTCQLPTTHKTRTRTIEYTLMKLMTKHGLNARWGEEGINLDGTFDNAKKKKKYGGTDENSI